MEGEGKRVEGERKEGRKEGERGGIEGGREEGGERGGREGKRDGGTCGKGEEVMKAVQGGRGGRVEGRGVREKGSEREGE